MLARMVSSEMASAGSRQGFELCNLVSPTWCRVFRAQNPGASLRALSASMERENRWIWRISDFSWDNLQIADVDLVPKFENKKLWHSNIFWKKSYTQLPIVRILQLFEVSNRFRDFPESPFCSISHPRPGFNSSQKHDESARYSDRSISEPIGS